MCAERLVPEQMERYQAHLALPGFGVEGQRRLLGSRALVIGAGGLGCPASQYLVAAGVGSVVLVDDDVVDATNLQRQVLYGESDVGRPKAEAAAARLRSMNSEVTVEATRLRVTAANVSALVEGCDVVVDGSDNFATRYVVNDAAVLAGIPLVTGSLYREEGQVTTLDPPETPCYRCLFPSPPPEPEACHEAGLLGPLAGIVGTIQATEAVRLLAGSAPALAGHMLLVDAATMAFRKLALRRDPECPLCGHERRIQAPTAVTGAGCRGGTSSGAGPADDGGVAER